MDLIWNVNKIIGPIFCQVSRINRLFQLNPLLTSGNQEWKGAAPIFIRRADLAINLNILYSCIIIFIKSKFKIENKSSEDPIDWAIKYLMAASVENLLLFLNRGIKDSKLISNPIQVVSHEYEEIEINVPMIMELKNKILKSFIIKKKRSKTFINGVWTH